jgi:hypothetical protein
VNESGGSITGQIKGGGSAGPTIINAGTIASGCYLQSGVTITNQTGGVIDNAIIIDDLPVSPIVISNQARATISGEVYGAIEVDNAAQANITNAGTLTGPVAAVDLSGGGTVDNLAGGRISGASIGILAASVAQISNSGSISGVKSVDFTGSGANSLTLQTGSVLIGTPVGSTASGATNALILQGAGAAANWFQNFTSLNMQGQTWTLSGESAIGLTKVSAGALIVTNFLRSSFNVLSGATLQVGDASHGGEIIANGAFTNGGVIQVDAGLADVTGAVSGAGGAVIAGGTLEFDSTFTQNVAFGGSKGVLQLANSQSYTGSISGFSLAGANSLDLRDIGFTSGTTKATYVDNGSHTGGVLTVTDGTHTAKIKLVGNFSGSTFTTSSDSHGGTTVVDPQAGPAVLPLIAAMASFGADAGHFTPTADSGRSSQPLLALAHSGG